MILYENNSVRFYNDSKLFQSGGINMFSILLVEDNDDHALLAQIALSKSGYGFQIDHVDSSEACFIALGNKNYSAILLDFSLPKKNGLEILKEIRMISYDAPVIMITSHGDEQIAVEAMKNGAYDYISKTDDYLNRLPVVIQRAIESHEMSKEQVRLQAKIEESEDRLRKIFNNVEVGIIEIKDDCQISYTNPKAKLYLNISEELQYINACEIFSNNSGNPRNCNECLINKCLEDGGLLKCDIEYNDRQFSITINSILVPPSNGRTDLVPSSNVITDQLTESNSRHLVSVLVDITEENNLQKHLIQSERLGALGRLASGIAHDFNNNLAIILGRTEFLLMNLGKIEKIEEGLQIMQKAALDGAEIVRRIQEFTGNKKKKEFIQLDVNELVKDVIRMTEPRWKDQSQRDGIEFDILAYFDSQQNIAGSDSDLREVLTNMIFNALNAMPEGGTISIKTYDENSNVNISISDTGFGISPKVIGNIFEPFFTTKDIGHSGMGLSVVYGIVKGHNGNIDVKSIPDKGTTLIITIPVSEGIIKAETESINSANPININVLVIDDEESIRDILKNVLVQFGNNVTDVSNGRSGIEVFQSGKFDVVITDLGMPEVSGWEVARQVKTIDPKIKVILLTGWDIELDEKGLKEKNVDFVINKPFRISQITKSIWECVGSGNN